MKKKPTKYFHWRAKRTGLGRVGVDPTKARSEGCFQDSGNRYCRQSPLAAITRGRSIKIAFAFDVVVPGYYAIIQADQLQPSHLGNVENPLHFIPEAQPRNRSTSLSGAETPVKMADSLRPAEIIEGANAYTGAPIVNTRGEVIQGNGRAYAMRYYYQKFGIRDPRGYADYIREAKEYLGISEPINLPKYPVVVRMVDVPDSEAIRLGQYKQSDLEALATKTNELKSRVNLIDDKALARVLESSFANSEPDATLSEIIRGTNLLAQLIRIGAIRPDQIEEFEKNGQINARGVAYISDLLLSFIFKGADVNVPEVFAQLSTKIQNSIMKATPYILRVDDAKSIKSEVANSILATRDFESSGYGRVDAWERSISMFGGTPKDRLTDLERYLVQVYTQSRTQAEIVQFFEQYLALTSDQEADMFTTFRPGMSKEKAIQKLTNIQPTGSKNIELAKAKLKLKLKLAFI